MGKPTYDSAHLRWLMQQKGSQGNYMSIKMIANGKAREYIEQCKPFRGSNLWGEWRDVRDGAKVYVVYSYRYTFPLYAYDEVADQWYENSTQFSQTTSRHRTQCRPSGVKTIEVCVRDMETIAINGGVGLIQGVSYE